MLSCNVAFVIKISLKSPPFLKLFCFSFDLEKWKVGEKWGGRSCLELRSDQPEELWAWLITISEAAIDIRVLLTREAIQSTNLSSQFQIFFFFFFWLYPCYKIHNVMILNLRSNGNCVQNAPLPAHRPITRLDYSLSFKLFSCIRIKFCLLIFWWSLSWFL